MLLENSGIPKLYRNCRVENLPYKETNIPLYEACRRYKSDILNKVLRDCKGLFLVGGVGTGKSTTACTLAIEYLISRVIDVYKNKNLIESIPVVFMGLQRLQEAYNTQYKIKNDLYVKVYMQMQYDAKHCDLLVIDDICVRGMTEAFQAELYNLIDTRLNEGRTTFITSNLGYTEITDILGERTVSRLKGLAGNEIRINGSDGRGGGITWI
jgi:DNA replication protein DnaC